MGNGTYLGGSTVIGRSTPSWFSWAPDTDIPDEMPAARPVAEGKKKLSRNDRRRICAERRERLRLRRSPAPATRPEMNTADEDKIAQLKRDIMVMESELSSVRRRLKAGRRELLDLVTKYGLDVGAYPESQSAR